MYETSFLAEHPTICMIPGVHLYNMTLLYKVNYCEHLEIKLTVLFATIDAQWEGMGNVGSSRYEPALLPLCPTIKV